MGDSLSRWRVDPGSKLDLSKRDPDKTSGAPGDGKDQKATTKKASAELTDKLAELQTRLWAEGKRSFLLVLQALDAGGKDGTVKHVFGGVNPAGVKVVSFKAPTETELAHDFLWRIHSAVPKRGEIGIFNRSHYEDVLIVRVNELAPEKVWRPRFEAIRCFEQQLTEAGTTIVKVFLHISKDEQAERFQDRLDDPAKNWKFAAGDLDVRERWDDYQNAYTEAIAETSTEAAPWYVIPADHKWYRNWAVGTILVETLDQLDLKYPPAEPGLDKIKIV